MLCDSSPGPCTRPVCSVLHGAPLQAAHSSKSQTATITMVDSRGHCAPTFAVTPRSVGSLFPFYRKETETQKTHSWEMPELDANPGCPRLPSQPRPWSLMAPKLAWCPVRGWLLLAVGTGPWPGHQQLWVPTESIPPWQSSQPCSLTQATSAWL